KVKFPGKVFYQQIFRAPGSEKIFEADVRSSIVRALYTASGEAPADQKWQPVLDPSAMVLPPAPTMPKFVTEEDIAFYTSEFQRSGFAGGLNYYRNMDRNWTLTPFLDGAKMLQPTLFVAGDRDAVIDFAKEAVDMFEHFVPNLKKKVILPGVG